MFFRGDCSRERKKCSCVWLSGFTSLVSKGLEDVDFQGTVGHFIPSLWEEIFPLSIYQ